MFDTTKVPHKHVCPCHKFKIENNEDQDGKIWTEEEIQTHLSELESIE